MPTMKYLTSQYGDSGFVKANCSDEIILNAITCKNSKLLSLKFCAKKILLTPEIMEKTKDYIMLEDVRDLLDVFAGRLTKSKSETVKRMIAQIN